MDVHVIVQKHMKEVFYFCVLRSISLIDYSELEQQTRRQTVFICWIVYHHTAVHCVIYILQRGLLYSSISTTVPVQYSMCDEMALCDGSTYGILCDGGTDLFSFSMVYLFSFSN